MYPEDKKYTVDSTHSTDSVGSGHSTYSTHSALNTLSTAIFYLAILFFIIGFNFSDRMAGNWYQQFLPAINNRPISDITFVDSLIGFAVTPYTANDTAYILKTTNSGDSWNRVFTGPTNSIGGFNRVKFLNLSTGFVCGNFLRKTTNGGVNWNLVNTSGIFPENMYVINEDTIWITDSDGLVGGVFRTSNGGASWQQQLNLGSQNPSKIYMYNGRIGFVSSTAGLYKTTNGSSWFNASNDFSFSDMFFIDSLTGWKASGFMKKTTNGGINWINQTLPSGGNIIVTSIEKFSNVNKDTIWGVSGYSNTGSGARGIIYRTTNGGDNWLYQIPDSNISIFRYFHNKFVNKNNGWAYNPVTGVHTIMGGDPVWLTPVQQISTEVPNEYKLYNNYPNPFNAMTKLKFQMSKEGYAIIKLFDITGKEVTVIVNEKLNTGVYEILFNANNLSSGVYFYTLIIDNRIIDTKKMMLFK